VPAMRPPRNRPLARKDADQQQHSTGVSAHWGRYLAGGLAILIVWAILAVVLLHRESFTGTGPLSLHQPALRSALPGGPSPDRVLAACFGKRSAGDGYKLVGGEVGGRFLYACYRLASDGTVPAAKVVDEAGRPVLDVEAVKRGGAWPWVGALNSGDDVFWAVLGTAILLLLTGLVYHRKRPAPARGGTPRWARRIALVTLGISATFPAWLLEWRVDAPGVAGALLPLVAFVYAIGCRSPLAGASRELGVAPRRDEHGAR
jgi:hypothetical protein